MAGKNDVPYAEFGARLMELRKTAGFNRQEFCEKCGVALSTMANYEQGKRIPYADTAVKMAQILDITVEELIGTQNPELSMAQEEAIDSMREINGRKGAERLRKMYAEAASFAGGDIDDDQLWEFSMEMGKLAMLAQQKLRERHTNKKYAETVEKKGIETKEAVDAINMKVMTATE